MWSPVKRIRFIFHLSDNEAADPRATYLGIPPPILLILDAAIRSNSLCRFVCSLIHHHRTVPI